LVFAIFTQARLTLHAHDTVDLPRLMTAVCSLYFAFPAESTTFFCVQKILNFTLISKSVASSRNCESSSAMLAFVRFL
jgi:hypothetical protein